MYSSMQTNYSFRSPNAISFRMRKLPLLKSPVGTDTFINSTGKVATAGLGATGIISAIKAVFTPTPIEKPVIDGVYNDKTFIENIDNIFAEIESNPEIAAGNWDKTWESGTSFSCDTGLPTRYDVKCFQKTLTLQNGAIVKYRLNKNDDGTQSKHIRVEDDENLALQNYETINVYYKKDQTPRSYQLCKKQDNMIADYAPDGNLMHKSWFGADGYQNKYESFENYKLRKDGLLERDFRFFDDKRQTSIIFSDGDVDGNAPVSATFKQVLDANGNVIEEYGNVTNNYRLSYPKNSKKYAIGCKVGNSRMVVCLDDDKKAMVRINDNGMIEIPKYSYSQGRNVKDRIRPEDVVLLNGKPLFTEIIEKDGIKYAISSKLEFKL